MNNSTPEKGQVLLVGNNKSIYGLAVCLQEAGHTVSLKTEDRALAEKCIRNYYEEALRRRRKDNGKADPDQTAPSKNNIKIESRWDAVAPAPLAIALTGENLEEKTEIIDRLEGLLTAGAPIAINTESIPLREIQKNAGNPQRILGMNWVDPVYNTLFLEIIRNDTTDGSIAAALHDLAADSWGKDPYTIKGELGIRMPLMAALIREAFSLVENDYATVEDIDRACRNDAGYYLPFAGNLRYMDLMGTYAYGMVMKDLNPELATDTKLPESFLNSVNRGETGMDAGAGFYTYTAGEEERWGRLVREFSFEIRELFERYPFSTLTEEVVPEPVKN